MPPGAPSTNRKRVAGPGLVSTTGSSGKRSSICSWMRRLGTTCPLVQMLSPSSGMNSMNRTSYPSLRAKCAKSTTSSSLWPFMTTMFNLIGHRPASRAAVMPSMTRSNASLRAMSLKVSMRSVSSEMLIRLSPASFSACAFCRRSTPFVVIVMSRVGSIALIMPMSSSSFTRTSGSPPVMRMVRTP